MKPVHTWEVQTRSQVQQEHTAPYFVSHLDSMSSNKLTSHSHYLQSISRFGTYASRLVAPAFQFPISFFLT